MDIKCSEDNYWQKGFWKKSIHVMIAREASRTYTKLKANVAKDISNIDQMKTCEAVLIKKKKLGFKAKPLLWMESL